MGLFDKMFEKKYCDICGEKIGLLGNRRLEDGNLCKDCAAKLSPWFSERRKSTVDQIKEQLAYREANKSAVAAFNTTRTLGKTTKLLMDEGNKKFMVTSAHNLAEANPDVLDFTQATGCNLEVKENRTELKQKDKDGKQVSYNPPRYEYSYNFHVTIFVNHPYFDEIRYQLSSGAVRTGERQMNAYGGSSWTVRPAAIGLSDRGLREYQEYIRMGEEIKQAVDEMRQGGQAAYAGQQGAQSFAGQPGAQQYGQSGTQYGQPGAQQFTPQELSQMMETAAKEAEQTAAQAAAAAPAGAVHMQKVTCPWCGGLVTAGAACELCGGPLE